MKHRRILAWLLAAVMAFGVMSAGVLAAETDAESGATAPSEAGDALKEQSRKESTEAGDGKTSKPSRGRKKKEQVAEPDGAIGKDRAKEIALADAGFTAEQTGKVRARVTEQDGTVIYKVRFTCDGQRYSYRIDAMSGEILDKSSAEAAAHPKGGRPSAGDAGETT